MQLNELYAKAADFGFLTVEEGMHLYHHAPLADLMLIADELRKKQVPHGKVTWQIDRNVNTTNVFFEVKARNPQPCPNSGWPCLYPDFPHL